MVDVTVEMNANPPIGQRGFRGNGNCDNIRVANKHADHPTGMESEIAPYNPATANGTNQAAYDNKRRETMPYVSGGTVNGGGQTRGQESELVPYSDSGSLSGGTAYNDPNYGPNHQWTTAEEEGLNSIPQDSFNDPLDADEAARNSWRALLARNVGRNVLARFLMGTQNIVTIEGELYEVGTDYVVIYQPAWDSHITADLYSIKFVEFREPPGVQLA